ncbi:DUF6776 family protein [Oceanisphaera avium]|uniref:Uncharacterized protein n=1 Tax=Oceanisphaera avium TaxID=1903694 RepID=A0A1Y0CY49_9GAMM|nr:DUF6776 family protein [Oceanisphaera avium]ART80241.1 hypothetical protein CBP12_08840 [Oceanisphaera avium]
MTKAIDRRLLGCGLACVLLGIALLIGGQGYYEQSQMLAQQQAQGERQRQEVLALRVELQALLASQASQLAQLEQQSQQLSAQTQQLALYRQVLASDGSAELLLAQEDITPLSQTGLFSYRLVLLQPSKTDKRITGVARIKVRALQNGVSVVLNDEVLGVAPVTLDFRHFQVLSGQLQLPSDSQAQTLELQLDLDGKALRTLSLNWPTFESE